MGTHRGKRWGAHTGGEGTLHLPPVKLQTRWPTGPGMQPSRQWLRSQEWQLCGASSCSFCVTDSCDPEFRCMCLSLCVSSLTQLGTQRTWQGFVEQKKHQGMVSSVHELLNVCVPVCFVCLPVCVSVCQSVWGCAGARPWSGNFTGLESRSH